MAKPKFRKEYNETSNRSVYNKARKRILENDAKIHCSYCGYHRGENNRNHYYAIDENAPDEWTKKYFNRTPSWKLATKNRKQWMIKNYKLKSMRHYRTNHEYFEIVI